MIWHHEQPSAVANELKTNIETGLTSAEAADRLKDYGHNHYYEKPTIPVGTLWNQQMKTYPTALIMIAAVFLLCYHILIMYFGGTASLVEPLIVLLLPPVAHLIGALWQKHGTSKLHHMTNAQTFTAKVLRDGEVQTVSAADIVRGDVLVLEAGMIIPADCRLITSDDLFCDEYAVTGEETDVAKNADITLDGITTIFDRANMVYAGCGVSRGQATALVVSTAQSTEYALKLNAPGHDASPLPGLSKDIASLERLVSLPILLLSAVLLGLGIVRNLPVLGDILNLIAPALALAGVAIPSTLTVAAVVAMAIGMHNVVHHSADVRDLSVMDTLSRVTVICADKTGTLTSDEKRPVSVFTGEIEQLTRMPSNRAQTLIQLATLCTANDTTKTGVDNHLLQNPTEAAIIEYARDIGIERRTLMEDTPRLSEIPFDTERRCMSVVHLVSGRKLMVTMGAPEAVLSACVAGPIEAATEANSAMAAQALRVLAVAYKYIDDASSDIDASHECDMTLAGLIALADQARDDSVLAIQECGQVGIITVMMTGDNEETACAVAKQLGILRDEAQLLTGDQLHAMSAEELKQSIGMYRVFARITPEDKEHIIRAWQARGAVVAATGNELADVPALQSADIGCATGAVDCDMTRNESDLTLYDNSFATLVTAIKQARGIYANIRKALQYTITCGFALLVGCFITLLAYKQFALSAASLALFFFIGVLCSMAIVYEAGDRHTLSEKPRRGIKRLMPGHAWVETLWQGALTGVCAYLAFDMGRSGAPDSMSETAFGMTTVFIMLMFSRLWIMLASHRHDPRRLRVSNRVMPIVFIIAAALTVLPAALAPVGVHFGLTTVGFSNWLLGLLLSAIPAMAIIVVRFVSQLLTTVRRGE